MYTTRKQPNDSYELILTEYNDLLNVRDLMEIFDASQQTIYQKIKDGTFGTPIKIGRAYKVPKITVLDRFFCA